MELSEADNLIERLARNHRVLLMKLSPGASVNELLPSNKYSFGCDLFGYYKYCEQRR